MVKIKNKLLYFLFKKRIDLYEDEKIKLRETILKMSSQLKEKDNKIELLYKEIEKLNWIIENRRTY